MNAVVLDLAVLGVEDLRALRLGAQVMQHRADVEGRPRVAAFFAALMNGIEHELARRAQGQDVLTRTITLGFDEAADWSHGPGGDHRFLLESLDLLGSNPRLSHGVRTTCASIRDRLVRTH